MKACRAVRKKENMVRKIAIASRNASFWKTKREYFNNIMC